LVYTAPGRALLQTLRAASAEDIPAEQGFNAANRSNQASQNAHQKRLVLLKMAFSSKQAIRRARLNNPLAITDETNSIHGRNTNPYPLAKSERSQPTTSGPTKSQPPAAGRKSPFVNAGIDLYRLCKGCCCPARVHANKKARLTAGPGAEKVPYGADRFKPRSSIPIWNRPPRWL